MSGIPRCVVGHARVSRPPLSGSPAPAVCMSCIQYVRCTNGADEQRRSSDESMVPRAAMTSCVARGSAANHAVLMVPKALRYVNLSKKMYILILKR